MNILKIDTSNNLITRVELITSGDTYVLEDKRDTPGDQNVLELVQKVLDKSHNNIEDIEECEVFLHSGSFTGLKVGAAIANALSFSCLISVNDKPLGNAVIPEY